MRFVGLDVQRDFCVVAIAEAVTYDWQGGCRPCRRRWPYSLRASAATMRSRWK
jgi:hypothetical protein